jgi:hypothetical protein
VQERLLLAALTGASMDEVLKIEGILEGGADGDIQQEAGR